MRKMLLEIAILILPEYLVLKYLKHKIKIKVSINGNNFKDRIIIDNKIHFRINSSITSKFEPSCFIYDKNYKIKDFKVQYKAMKKYDKITESKRRIVVI